MQQRFLLETNLLFQPGTIGSLRIKNRIVMAAMGIRDLVKLDGRDVTESCRLAKRLEEAGVDGLEIDAGCYESWYWAHPPTYMPIAPFLDEIMTIKKTVSIPVIV